MGKILLLQRLKLNNTTTIWFCRNYGLALPLVALQYHQVKLMITLKPFSECWKKDFDTFYLDKVNDIVTINSSVTDGVKIDFQI